MQRIAVLAFSIVSYLFFFIVFLYLMAFVVDAPSAKSVSHGSALWQGPTWLVDLAVLALFGLQHSIMARGWFKHRLARYLPAAMIRSVFVLATAIVLVAMFLCWQPLPSVLWHAEGAGALVLHIGQAAGWLMVLSSTFLIDHFELFGLKQGWAYFHGRALDEPPLKAPALYRVVRHPIYLGFLIAFWSAPTMTVGRLLFASGMSAYILLGIRFEERDLLRRFGEGYQRYRERVGMLVPRRQPRPTAKAASRV